MDMKNNLLLRMANTIVANLDNTESAGLFHGKAGLCLFLYRYAAFSGREIYTETASMLLDDIFRMLNPSVPSGVTDGLSGIGCALCDLLKEGLVEGGADVLRDLDDTLLRSTRDRFRQEMAAPVPLLSSGLYLLRRMELQKDSVESLWVGNVVEDIRFVTTASRRDYRPKLSLLHSMLHVLHKLYAMTDTDRDILHALTGEVLELAGKAVTGGRSRQVDIALFRTELERLPDTLQSAKDKVRALPEMCGADRKTIPPESWYDDLWWYLLYGVAPVPDTTEEELTAFINRKMEDAFFDDTTVNSRLAAMGLWMMKTMENKKEKQPTKMQIKA